MVKDIWGGYLLHWHTQALLDRLICYINRGVVPIMQKKKKNFL